MPVGGFLRRALWQYGAARPEALGGNNRLILTTDGWPMSIERVRKMLVHKGLKAGVDNVHPYRFRHSFALHHLPNGGGAKTLHMLMGHTTLQMVGRYLQLASADLKAAHAKTSPADHLRL